MPPGNLKKNSRLSWRDSSEGNSVVTTCVKPWQLQNKVLQDKADLLLVAQEPCQASFNRLSHIREQHQTEGFSEDVTEILLSATRASTHKTYQSAGRLWSSWCYKRKVNPISATLNDALLFLTDRFKNGAAYRSVNVACSAVTSCHPNWWLPSRPTPSCRSIFSANA